MTKEQLKKAVNDRESQIKNLKKQIEDLRQTYLEENCEFEEGEKVIIIDRNDVEHIAFISRIWTTDGDINFSFVKVKKDGTPSNHHLYVWYGYKVKKLNSDKGVQECDATGLNQG